MARRLEELRRAAGNSQLRAAYEAAIYGLDAVLYRLAMLRTSPEPARRQVSATPATKAAAPTRAAAARIGATRKQWT